MIFLSDSQRCFTWFIIVFLWGWNSRLKIKFFIGYDRIFWNFYFKWKETRLRIDFLSIDSWRFMITLSFLRFFWFYCRKILKLFIILSIEILFVIILDGNSRLIWNNCGRLVFVLKYFYSDLYHRLLMLHLTLCNFLAWFT